MQLFNIVYNRLFKRSARADAANFYRFLFSARPGQTAWNGTDLQELYRRSELAFSCINKIADVMNDAEMIVERRTRTGEWEPEPGHPLAVLFKRPNPDEIGTDFRRKLVQSENIAGHVFFRLIRPRPEAPPTAIYVLNPQRVMPQVDHAAGRIQYYRYSNALGYSEDIAPTDVIVRRRADLTDEWGGLAPLYVAANTIDGDENLTDYVNSFLDPSDGSGGIPSGILKFTGSLSPEMAAQKRKLWNRNTRANEVQVLDQNADFQAIGSKLAELDSGTLREQHEARICSVFGVPPILVGAYVGLRNVTQNATVKGAMRDFWANRISPELKAFREWLTWTMLPLFESEDEIRAERVRAGFDLSQMLALSEDVDAIHDRARKNFAAGGWTLNEFREATGRPADPAGDYYLQPRSLAPLGPDARAQIAEQVPAGDPSPVPADGPPKHLPAGDTETKAVEWDGMVLRREPTPTEQIIGLKTLAAEQEAQAASVETALMRFRDQLVAQAVEAAKELDGQSIFTLTLSRNEKLAKQVQARLEAAYAVGAAQIVREIEAQRGGKSERKDKDRPKRRLTEIADTILSQVLNEMQARAVNVFTALKLLGFDAEGFFDEMLDRLRGESTKFVETLASNAANLAIQSGRADEIGAQTGNWDRIEYSAILDSNTCEACEAEDGTTADDPADLVAVPNPDCDGGARCRCFHVAVLD